MGHTALDWQGKGSLEALVPGKDLERLSLQRSFDSSIISVRLLVLTHGEEGGLEIGPWCNPGRRRRIQHFTCKAGTSGAMMAGRPGKSRTAKPFSLVGIDRLVKAILLSWLDRTRESPTSLCPVLGRC